MKKLTIAMGLMLMASVFTACTNDDATTNENTTEQREGKVQQIAIQTDFVAFDADSRSTFDPLTQKTSWNAADQLKVFYRPTGATTPWLTSILSTSEADAKLGIFKGEALTLEDVEYDWYITTVCEATATITDPANNGVANRLSFGMVTYNAEKGQAHIGDRDMLVACIKASATAPEVIEFKRPSTMLKFKIVNNEEAPVTFKSITIMGSEGSCRLGGTWPIKYDLGTLGIATTSSTIPLGLNFENVPSIAKGESMDVYMLAPAFKFVKDKYMRITVESSTGAICTSKIISSADLTFEGNKINTATIIFEQDAAKDITGGWNSGVTNDIQHTQFFSDATTLRPSTILDGLKWVVACTAAEGADMIYAGVGRFSVTNSTKATFTTTNYKSAVASVSIIARGRLAMSVTVGGIEYQGDANATIASIVSDKTAVFTPKTAGDFASGDIVVTYTNTPQVNTDTQVTTYVKMDLTRLAIETASR